MVAATFSKWRAKYGGMQVNQVKAMKNLNKENERLKKIVAEQVLYISMLIKECEFPHKKTKFHERCHDKKKK